SCRCSPLVTSNRLLHDECRLDGITEISQKEGDREGVSVRCESDDDIRTRWMSHPFSPLGKSSQQSRRPEVRGKLFEFFEAPRDPLEESQMIRCCTDSHLDPQAARRKRPGQQQPGPQDVIALGDQGHAPDTLTC